MFSDLLAGFGGTVVVANRAAGREPPGYQQAPQFRIIVGCGIGALLLATFAAVVNFTTGQHPETDQIPGEGSNLTIGRTAVLPTDLLAALHGDRTSRDVRRLPAGQR